MCVSDSYSDFEAGYRASKLDWALELDLAGQ